MDQAAAEGTNFVILYIATGFTICAALGLALYNLVVLVSVIQSGEEESASNMSKAGWAIGFVSLWLGPCAGFGGLLALGLGMMETRRIYRDESTYASAVGARMAKTNGGVILVLTAVVSMFAVVTFFL